MQVIDLNCSGCGGSLTPDMTSCKYCGRAIVISSFNTLSALNPLQLKAMAKSIEQGNCATALSENGADGNEGNANFALGGCYLKLALYDKALEKFENAIDEEYNNSEVYFYAAASLLKGKKAFLTPMANIKKAIEYTEAALMLENRGIYHYFLAYIKYDFYSRKYLKIAPSWQEEYTEACNIGTSESDIQELFNLLKVPKPECFA
jgi:tetratricopeptide (TPR) repeat protein